MTNNRHTPDGPFAVPPVASFTKPRLTTKAWAHEAGVSDTFISRVCHGQSRASRRVRDAAVRLLGLPEDELFGDRLDVDPC